MSTRMWPSGRYVPQTRGEAIDVVDTWANSTQTEDKIADEDIVVFVTFGATHIPRPEDFPVYVLSLAWEQPRSKQTRSMPAEHVVLSLKPWSFFKMNPSLDVPASKDVQSVRAFPEISTGTGHVPAEVIAEASCCT